MSARATVVRAAPTPLLSADLDARLVMAMTGRKAHVNDLTGDGVEGLRSRCQRGARRTVTPVGPAGFERPRCGPDEVWAVGIL